MSCLLFKTQLSSICLFVPHRQHIKSPLRAQQVNAMCRFMTNIRVHTKKTEQTKHVLVYEGSGIDLSRISERYVKTHTRKCKGELRDQTTRESKQTLVI
jgi:hypothetical protein